MWLTLNGPEGISILKLLVATCLFSVLLGLSMGRGAGVVRAHLPGLTSCHFSSPTSPNVLSSHPNLALGPYHGLGVGTTRTGRIPTLMTPWSPGKDTVTSHTYPTT